MPNNLPVISVEDYTDGVAHLIINYHVNMRVFIDTKTANVIVTPKNMIVIDTKTAIDCNSVTPQNMIAIDTKTAFDCNIPKYDCC